ncbi:hypothetical protein MLD38_020546 [Melastoma candidum]|uniref:Uncharacterized protein n=1 Tax=Melastoma candidum TaxID=119954 RepID=A0ACB9QDJ0_9MYRT|nr:hypothetical protein MLD38_020546 [Melastoma candidum]
MSMVINNDPNSAATSTSSLSTVPPSPSAVAFRPGGFLDQCFLCSTKLSPGKDIYMYRGDRAFCSEECRCRQILLDEEDAFGRGNNHGHCSVGGRAAPHPSSSRNNRSRGRV